MIKWKASVSADLNLPDRSIDLNAVGFRTKGLCVGGKRKHWFGLDFLKLSMLIYVQLRFFHFDLSAWNMVPTDSLASSPELAAFNFLTSPFSLGRFYVLCCLVVKCPVPSPYIFSKPCETLFHTMCSEGWRSGNICSLQASDAIKTQVLQKNPDQLQDRAKGS